MDGKCNSCKAFSLKKVLSNHWLIVKNLTSLLVTSEKMKDVKRRIANHKTRLDIGKGDVDFDGLPGKDDIKDIGYATQSCEVR